jgi:small conductance mechanosensitive channel
MLHPTLLLAQETADPATTSDGATPSDGAFDSAAGLFTEAAKGDLDAIFELSTTYVLPAIVFLLIVLVAYFVGKFLGRAAEKPVSNRVDPMLGLFVGKIVFYAILIGAILGALQYLGVGVASFAAVIAAAGFAVGLAFQGSLSNLAAGIMLLVFRPFKVGDAVNAAGITAKVQAIDLFFTVFDTFDNRRIIVPNSDVLGGNIENITYHPERRADVDVGISYDADIKATRAALEKAADSVSGLVRGEGRGYQVLLKGFGASSVDWVVRCWLPGDDFWVLKEEQITAIKRELEAAGISIPYPQMDVHMQKNE